jgi:serine/threonine protein kinase
MEVHPQTLEHHYRSNGRNITAAEKQRMCTELCEALLFVEQQGFVHLDVKMTNVLVAANGRLVLSDFGTAKPINAHLVGGGFGNPEHIAPEVLRAINAGLRPPLTGQPGWECGTMFHEMIVGEHPYPTYPAPGLLQEHYPELDVDHVDRLRESGVAGAFIDVSLGLVQWDAAQRMPLITAQRMLRGAMDARPAAQTVAVGATKAAAPPHRATKAAPQVEQLCSFIPLSSADVRIT